MKYASGSSVGERGQITIERSIRERLGVRPKDIAVQRVEEGHLVVEFIRPHTPHMRSLAGFLAPTADPSREPVDLDASVGRGIAEEWREYLTREESELRRQTP
jgi:bifunctional DNA-binding transcriptional regulator/antitoxin component of YhaV-PrlF toxin-antitoxin module